MTGSNPFSGHSRDALIRAVGNIVGDAEYYGDSTRINLQEFGRWLLEELAEAETDEDAQRIVAGAFPSEELIDEACEALGRMFESHGTKLQDHNTMWIGHGIVRDRLE